VPLQRRCRMSRPSPERIELSTPSLLLQLRPADNTETVREHASGPSVPENGSVKSE
jgi:hypothetical protein